MTGVSTPQFHPLPREPDDMELLVSGALEPITRFTEPGSPVPPPLPEGRAGETAADLAAPEGLPLAIVGADGAVPALPHAQHGPFRALYRRPAQAREAYAGATFVPVTDALD